MMVTDYCATLICEDYNVPLIINLSNTDKVYDKDPNKFKNAKPKDKMSWKEFRAMVGDKWTPGMHAPFDPVAAKRSDELGIKVVVMSGSDLDNVSGYRAGRKFVGTVID